MKFFLAAGMALSLIGVALLAMLAMSYIYQGSGLNPWLAGFISAFLLSAGYQCAKLLEGQGA